VELREADVVARHRLRQEFQRDRLTEAEVIRAETVGFDDFVTANGWKGARDKGLVRSEGKEYVVKDGDVLLFRFNV